MPPRPNRIGLLEGLKIVFPRQNNFTKQMIDLMLNDSNRKGNGENANSIFQSLSTDEKRIFTIINSIIPTFNGKRSVILSDNLNELEYMMGLVSGLIPGLELKYVDDALLKKHWDGYGSPEEFATYNILFCKPHHLLCLQRDFKGIATNLGAVCFHDVVPSMWYYTEVFALTIMLTSSRRPIPLYYSSSSGLPHIQAIGSATWKTFNNYELPPLRKDVSWHDLVVPITDWGLYDFYLRKSIVKELKASQALRSSENGAAMLLLTADRTKHAYFNRLLYKDVERESGRLEIISPGGRPKSNEKVDIIFLEDYFLEPVWKGFDSLLEQILTVLSYLKHRGKVIFFSPQGGRVKETDALLSALFPVQFNRAQKEIIILFLLFRASLLKKEILILLNSCHNKSIFHVSSKELDSLLKSLKRYGGIKELKGRYTCTHWKENPNVSAGETVVRYRSFLEHRIQYHIKIKCKEEIANSEKAKSERIFNRFAIIGRELTKKLKYCPHITNLPILLRDSSYLISQDLLERLLETSLDEYLYSRTLFSRCTPEFQKFAPPEHTKVDSTRDKKDFSHHRQKPPGRKHTKHHRSPDALEKVVLQEIEYKWKITKVPIFWRDVIDVLGIPASKGYRIIRKLINKKKLKELKLRRSTKPTQCILEPKKSDMDDNKVEVRGRPKLYIVPFAADLLSINMKPCGTCHMFTRTNQCELISTLLKIGKPEGIRHLDIREVLEGKETEVINPQLHPHMKACSLHQQRMKDRVLKSYKPAITYVKGNDGTLTEIYAYKCNINGCGAVMKHPPHIRTFKCPRCHTKYTRKIQEDGTVVFKVNIDHHSTKNAVIQKECGIIEEDELERKERAKKWAMTKRHKTLLKKKRKELPPPTEKKMVDRQLRRNYKRKYGKQEFFRPRILGNLLSAALATRELKIFAEIFEPWLIDRYFYVQLEQIRRSAEATTLNQFQTAERVIANQYLQVYGTIMAHYGFDVSDRKLLRHVSEFMERPYRGSKGYSPGNTLVNNTHKVRYEKTRTLCYDVGFGWDCPGFAEHAHPTFGLVLDLSDPVKYADRFTLLQAIVKGKITGNSEGKATEDPEKDVIQTIEAQLTKKIKEKVTHEDIYSIFGRQNQEIFFVKSKSFQKLGRLSKGTDHKVIYRIADNSGGSFEAVPVGKAFAQFVKQLAQSLMHGDRLESSFIYAPNLDDYEYVCNILMENNIVVSSILHK